jgi:hypothetical protein
VVTVLGAAAATTAALLAALAWTVPAPLAVGVAVVAGLASALGGQWSRVATHFVVAGLAAVTAPFQSAPAAIGMLALATLLVGFALVSLAQAPRSIRALAAALAAIEMSVILWVMAHAG